MTARAAKLIPNSLTLARVAVTPVMLDCIARSAFFQAFMVFVLVGFTDILDGLAARALHASTRLGACLDVFADLVYIMASLLALNAAGLAPAWFTLVAALKFLEFAATSTALKKGECVEGVWEYDCLGRVFAALAFILPGATCLSAAVAEDASYIANCLVFPACALAVASSTLRIVRCARRMRSFSVAEKRTVQYGGDAPPPRTGGAIKRNGVGL